MAEVAYNKRRIQWASDWCHIGCSTVKLPRNCCLVADRSANHKVFKFRISYMSATISRSFPISPPPCPLTAASTSTYERIASDTDPQLQQMGSRLFEPDVAKLFDERLVRAFHD